MFRLGVFTITVLGPYITNDSHVKLTDTINANNAIRFARTVVICLPTCNGAAAVILAAIAIDRYKRVCRPHGKQITTVRAKRMALLALIVSVQYSLSSQTQLKPK
jgi:hypothetical protein